jgi:hypothetical protein
MEIGEKIREIALTYVGQTELKNNSGFKDSTFQSRMQQTGWRSGLSWCAFTGELIYTEAYKGTTIERDVIRLFSGSATETFKNFDLDPSWQTSTTVPVIGAIAVWRHGLSWQGHLAIVTGVNIAAGTFETVEGNSNNDGSREGVEVVNKTGAKSRKIKTPFSKKGLNLVGFIYPKQIPE